MRFLILLCLLMHSVFALNIEKPSVYTNQTINGWMMSEKLDGIRAVWDGKVLKTKNGNIIYAPKGFTHNFPPFYLDGELWSKRNDFETIQSIVLDKTPSKNWQTITYNVFEVPYEKGDFIQRLNKAKEWFQSHPNQYVQFIQQVQCQNKKHLEQFLESIIAKKGEGVIIKNPKLGYIQGRSTQSLKVKKFLDMEGVVIAINYKNNQQMKSLKVQLQNGIVFNLGGGFSNKERLNHPKVGETVTFKYYGLTKKGKPKFASFLRVRKKE